MKKLTCLTNEELEVAIMRLQGLTLKQIARRLGKSESTISTHRDMIYTKLNIHSVAELFNIYYNGDRQ